jgi:CSLREA domain-containing protein
MASRPRAAIAMGVLLLGATPFLAHAADTKAASAPRFVVNSTVDAPDANVGDGKCAITTDGGPCTLRAAVQEADTASGSTVVVPAGRFRLSIPPVAAESFPGSTLAVNGAAGDLDIDQVMTVRGAGAGRTVIDGAGLDRVFAIGNVGTGHLSDMTVTGGDPSQLGTNQGIALGGAIFNGGKITLDRMALVGNRADGGGGMFSIPGTSPVIRDTLIAGNRAYSGGGLRLDAGATIINSTITGNTLLPLPSTAEALPRRPFPTAFALAVSEGSGWGGGIDNRGGGDVLIVNSTITNNHAIKGGGGVAAGQGYAPVSPAVALGVMTLRNTIIAGNSSSAGEAGCHIKDQVIRSLGHNLASDGSCFLTAAGDHPSTNPKLGRLASNGGPTQTQALLRGSPAIDAAIGCPGHDQRGFARPAGKRCDIGAFEYTGR